MELLWGEAQWKRDRNSLGLGGDVVEPERAEEEVVSPSRGREAGRRKGLIQRGPSCPGMAAGQCVGTLQG